MALWIIVGAAFRLYVAVGGRPGTGVSGGADVIATVGRAVAAVIATMLWTFLSSLAILVGAKLNAVLE